MENRSSLKQDEEEEIIEEDPLDPEEDELAGTLLSWT